MKVHDPRSPVFVVSDVHLGAVPAETERAFRAFLDFAFENSAALLINGDLFDVWVPSAHFVMRGYVRVLTRIAELTEAGFPVYFVGGNHDAVEYGRNVFEQDIGMQLLSDPSTLKIGAFHALVAHGDGIGPGKGEYQKENRALRTLLRNDSLRALAERLLPTDWVFERASRWSRVPRIVLRRQRGEGTGPKPDAAKVERWALEQLRRSREVDLVLAGHSHLPAWREPEPGRYYVNTGDWIEHMSYAVISPDGRPPELRRWPTQELLFPRQVPEISAEKGIGARP